MENKIKHSVDYIANKAGKQTSFTTPNNYFDNLEEAIAVKLSEENLPKNNGFTVPNNYFDNIESNILEKISTKETKVISLKGRISKIIPYVAAASIALFIGINSYIFSSSETSIFDELADSEIENWISNHISSINETDFAIAYSDIEFDESEIIPNSISNDELENYLNDENNISLILEND